MQTVNELYKTYNRPWGSYRVVALDANYQVKVISVNPGGRLSTQLHHRRSEHWIVTAGTPTVTVGATTKVCQPNEHVFIPLGMIHRLENLTQTEVTIIEIQFGDYLGEDDIVRLADIYGRI